MKPTAAPARAGEKIDATDRAAARHIVVAHENTKPARSRTREEALERAKTLRARLLAGEDMGALAVEASDGPSGSRGGWLGSFERDAWVQSFDDAVWGLEVGALSEPVETIYGFHLIRREPIDQVRLRHLVVQFAGTENLSIEPATRERALARERVDAARAALDDGADFAAVAAEYSDGPLGARGADLGWFLRGELGADFDEVVFGLEVGEISAVTESIYGFHILERAE
jgi:parvulin-like peptidyl-prolyl isomerase